VLMVHCRMSDRFIALHKTTFATPRL
jgi:hypothetical protein